MAAISRAPRHAPTLRQLPGAQTALETESPAPLGAAARQPAPGRREPGLGGRPPAPRPPLSPALYQKHERGADYAYSSREFLEKSSWLPTNSYELLKFLGTPAPPPLQCCGFARCSAAPSGKVDASTLKRGGAGGVTETS